MYYFVVKIKSLSLKWWKNIDLINNKNFPKTCTTVRRIDCIVLKLLMHTKKN